jgi:hypothetical protein
MTSKNVTEQTGKNRRYTVLGNKALRVSKMNQEAIQVLRRLRGKWG